MRTHVRLGRVFGVEVGLHASWFVVAALLFLALAARFHAGLPGASPILVWTAAAAAALVFFAGLLLHELSHVAVARARGLGVHGITLFALGGVAQSAEDARDPGSELLIGAVGPFTSAALGLLFLWGAWAIGFTLHPALAILRLALGWLGAINLGLAAFNLIPAFPMDGGRVLRAAVWKLTGDRGRATRIAASAGRLAAAFFVVLGAFSFLTRGALGGVWIAMIGLFLYQAAAVNAWSGDALDALKKTRVADVMDPGPDALPGDTVDLVVRDKMLRQGRTSVLIRQDGRLLGLVTPDQLNRIPREEWPRTCAAQVMVPVEKTPILRPDASCFDALELMGREHLAVLPVVGDGTVVGILTQADILRTVETIRAVGLPVTKT